MHISWQNQIKIATHWHLKFNKISYDENGRFALYDFLSHDEPIEVGNIKLIGDPSIRDIIDADSSNNNYIGVVRHNIALIQTVIPKQEYVDLSKWIKQTYRIKL